MSGRDQLKDAYEHIRDTGQLSEARFRVYETIYLMTVTEDREYVSKEDIRSYRYINPKIINQKLNELLAMGLIRMIEIQVQDEYDGDDIGERYRLTNRKKSIPLKSKKDVQHDLEEEFDAKRRECDRLTSLLHQAEKKIEELERQLQAVNLDVDYYKDMYLCPNNW